MRLPKSCAPTRSIPLRRSEKTTQKPNSCKERTYALGVVVFHDMKCNAATYKNVRCGVSEIASSSAKCLSYEPKHSPLYALPRQSARTQKKKTSGRQMRISISNSAPDYPPRRGSTRSSHDRLRSIIILRSTPIHPRCFGHRCCHSCPSRLHLPLTALPV